MIAVANSLTSLASTAPSGSPDRNSRHPCGRQRGKITDVLKACAVDEQRYFISALGLEGEACFATAFHNRAAGHANSPSAAEHEWHRSNAPTSGACSCERARSDRGNAFLGVRDPDVKPITKPFQV